MVSARRAEVLPLIFGALYRNCENHWHRYFLAGSCCTM